MSETPSVLALAVSCMCMERGSRAKTLPEADAGVKSCELKAGAGISCPMSTIALGVLVLDEPLNAWIGMGTLLVLGGVFMVSKYGAK